MVFVVRNAQTRDLPSLLSLSRRLNTVNMPQSEEELGDLIAKSESSFSGKEQDPQKRVYLFALENTETGEVIGTSQIIAQHGTKCMPHVFFDVYEDERYAHSLQQGRKHTVLRLGFNYSGPTEVGGLVLDPAHRGGKNRLGLLLSYARFALMALHPENFEEEVLAELLPAFEPSGDSYLWDALGSKFCDLTYLEADRRSRVDKEFILKLFPGAPIYATLFDEKTQKSLEVVGVNSMPAKKMLKRIGFSYAKQIDPFDGGPHYKAKLNEITLVKNGRNIGYLGDCALDANLPWGLCASFVNPFTKGAGFKALLSQFDQRDARGICLDANAAGALGIKIGQTLWHYRL